MPARRQDAIVSASKPSSVRMRSVCSPTAGIFPILGSTSSNPKGGTRARSGPAGESTSRQLSRAASCGCSRNSSTVLIRALAICADSSRSTTCCAVFPANACMMIVSSSSWCSTRNALEPNRGSLAQPGLLEHVGAEARPLALVLKAQIHARGHRRPCTGRREQSPHARAPVRGSGAPP